MDRLVKYIKILDTKVQKINSDLLEIAKQNELAIDLIEEDLFRHRDHSLTKEENILQT